MEVHGLAARWHRENGNFEEAVQQLLEMQQQYAQLVQSNQILRNQYDQMLWMAKQVPVNMAARYRAAATGCAPASIIPFFCTPRSLCYRMVAARSAKNFRASGAAKYPRMKTNKMKLMVKKNRSSHEPCCSGASVAARAIRGDRAAMRIVADVIHFFIW